MSSTNYVMLRTMGVTAENVEKLSWDMADFVLDVEAAGRPHSTNCNCENCELYARAVRLAERLIPAKKEPVCELGAEV